VTEDAMALSYVLIDFENKPIKSLRLLEGKDFHVMVFLGPKNRNIPADVAVPLHGLKERGAYIELPVSGKNALDFHIASYLGELSGKHPQGVFYVISGDKGYDSLLKHLKNRNINCRRLSSIEQIPGLDAVPTMKPAKTTPSAPPQVPAIEALIQRVVTDLIKRKSAKPGTIKALQATIRNTCGKDCPQATLDTVFKALVSRGHVLLNGSKVTYQLPDA
jgi:hypothetical protein